MFALTVAVLVVACSDGSGTTSTTTSSRSDTSSTSAPTTTTSLIEITSPTWFSTPSGNISCAVRPDYARCDITKRAWEPPAKPSSCILDWGPSLFVDATQAGRFGCVSDSLHQPDVVVPYGRSVRNGAMSCDVLPEGVTCRSGAGHGFFVSLESYRLF